MGLLDGQVALITGAGSGIGLATATAFAGQGAKVALLGRRAGPLEDAAAGLGTETVVLPCDVADPAAVAAAVAAVVERWGRLDVVVNNAGLNVVERGTATVSPQDWDTVLAVNLRGTFLVTQAALPTMRSQGSGTVLNVSSYAGWRPMALTGPAYSAAKAGVNAFTESLNLTERRYGVRSCAVCPGEVATPILDRRPVPPSAEARADMLQPEDLAQTLLFLAALPQRVSVELLTMTPTVQRDWAAEV